MNIFDYFKVVDNTGHTRIRLCKIIINKNFWHGLGTEPESKIPGQKLSHNFQNKTTK